MQNTKIQSLNNALVIRDLTTGIEYTRTEDGAFADVDGNIATIDNPALYDVVEFGPEPVPQFSVVNGKLVPAVEQGQIAVKDIIASVPGAVILAVEPLHSEAKAAGKVDIMTYRPGDDSFTKLFREVPEPTLTILNEDDLLLTINTVEEKSITREDGTEDKVLTFIRGSVNLLEGGSVIASYNLDAPVDKVTPVTSPNGNVQIVLLSASDTQYDEDADALVIVPRNGLLVTRLSHFLTPEDFTRDQLEEIGEAELNGVDSIDTMTADYRGNIFVKAGNLFYYSNDGFRPRFVSDPAVAKTSGYDRLAKLSFEDDGNTAKYLLYNAARETITLVDKRTRDRGHIVTVESEED